MSHDESHPFPNGAAPDATNGHPPQPESQTSPRPTPPAARPQTVEATVVSATSCYVTDEGTVESIDPLERQNGETEFAYRAFIAYCEMGTPRSLRNLQATLEQQVTNGQTTEFNRAPTFDGIAHWSYKHRWQQRLLVYLQRERKAHEAAKEERRRYWREQVETEEWEQGNRLKEMGDAVLAQSNQFLETRRRLVPGKKNAQGQQIEPDREIVTVRLKANEGLKAIEMASKMRRMVSGLPTDSVKNEVDFRNMTDAQLRAYLIQLHEQEESALARQSLEAPAIDPNEAD